MSHHHYLRNDWFGRDLATKKKRISKKIQDLIRQRTDTNYLEAETMIVY
jgi:hypothetical protein